MSTKVFISHAGSERAQALAVSDRLRHYKLEPVLDFERVKPGDSFINFMEEVISDCAYCLLLWSQAASERRWVTEEWQAAYHRSVTTGQSFLVIGRLEDVEPPNLLRPRSRIELFPELDPGLSQLVAMWREDEVAAAESNREVRPPIRTQPSDGPGQTIYVSTTVFGKTFPINVDLSVPTALATERIVTYLDAPRQLDFEGRIGIRFHYGLCKGGTTLEPAMTPAEQGVGAGSLLELEVTQTPLSTGELVTGQPTAATYRGGESDIDRIGRDALEWSADLGLGF